MQMRSQAFDHLEMTVAVPQHWIRTHSHHHHIEFFSSEGSLVGSLYGYKIKAHRNYISLKKCKREKNHNIHNIHHNSIVVVV